LLRHCVLAIGLAASPAIFAADASAQESEAELAEKLNNPVASLISVPLQSNFDFNIGPDNGWKYLLNVQPVAPFSLNEDWNLISRTIVPVVYQEDIFPGAGDQSGLADTLQSLFFSPKKPGPGGVIWAVGPVFLLPTGTDELLGSEKWGIGPTALALKQQKGFTYGVLANHIWSFAGEENRADVNSTFLQPFLSYTSRDAWTLGVNVEASYDWETEQWSAPLNTNISKVVKFGEQRVSIGGGLRYWLDSPDGGPEGVGLRLVVTFLFPEK
jgi:hypothetical protein